MRLDYFRTWSWVQTISLWFVKTGWWQKSGKVPNNMELARQGSLNEASNKSLGRPLQSLRQHTAAQSPHQWAGIVESTIRCSPSFQKDQSCTQPHDGDMTMLHRKRDMNWAWQLESSFSLLLSFPMRHRHPLACMPHTAGTLLQEEKMWRTRFEPSSWFLCGISSSMCYVQWLSLLKAPWRARPVLFVVSLHICVALSDS